MFESFSIPHCVCETTQISVDGLLGYFQFLLFATVLERMVLNLRHFAYCISDELRSMGMCTFSHFHSLSAQGLLLGPYGLLGIESGSVRCKASTLPTLLSLGPQQPTHFE